MSKIISNIITCLIVCILSFIIFKEFYVYEKPMHYKKFKEWEYTKAFLKKYDNDSSIYAFFCDNDEYEEVVHYDDFLEFYNENKQLKEENKQLKQKFSILTIEYNELITNKNK